MYYARDDKKDHEAKGRYLPANKKLLVVDFDNTLFDWVSLWHACFSAMMAEVTNVSGISFDVDFTGNKPGGPLLVGLGWLEPFNLHTLHTLSNAAVPPAIN